MTLASQTNYTTMRTLSPPQARAQIRMQAYTGHTAGMAPGRQQGNIVILPEAAALDFFRYCQRNPKPCPLIGVSDTGDPTLPTLGGDIDIRHDVPKYRIFHGGELKCEATDLSELWRDDLVTFVLGCSFGFETALMRAGLKLDHIENDTIVPMYRTNIETVAAGAFAGPIVVSMRAFAAAQVQSALDTTAAYPEAHGAPLHVGNPEAIGITDLSLPDWGDPPNLTADDIPIFWACGVTPQVAIENAKPDLCITHAPGSMLITDLSSELD